MNPAEEIAARYLLKVTERLSAESGRLADEARRAAAMGDHEARRLYEAEANGVRSALGWLREEIENVEKGEVVMLEELL